jgi:ABC-type antimicrobial peptide transport system permease subunit
MIDGILIYSMMLNDVEERTYEFAMLRTLGFKNKSLIVLLVIQALF